MKPVKYLLSIAVALFIGLSMYAQTASEILAKYVDATGGKEKLSAINSVRLENSIDAGGFSATGYSTVLNGKGYRSESDWGGQKLIQVYTDQSGWTVNPFVGINDPQAMPAAQYKSGAGQIYAIPFLDYEARGSKAEITGQEKLGGINAYKVKLTSKDSVATTYYFDPTTYYILQSVTTTDFNGQPADLTIKYSDYKKNDYGWTIPYTVDIDFGGQFSMTSKITKAEVNNPVDVAIFEMKK